MVLTLERSTATLSLYPSMNSAVCTTSMSSLRSLSTSRETLEDVELEGFFIPKGEAIFPNIGAAHWNPNYFPNPENFDIYRPEKPAHLNFGGGIFSCIGRFAVTIEIEEVITFMTREFPNFKIKKSRFSHSPMFTSVEDLVGSLIE